MRAALAALALRTNHFSRQKSVQQADETVGKGNSVKILNEQHRAPVVVKFMVGP